MTIEELFGTLQQSVVAVWRKHLRTHKYSKHVALNDFYEEMPEKVDALIEAWMGANGKKVNGFDNIIVSKNMGTLKYLKELKSIVKQGYPLMNGDPELEALLDDIAELIDSTLYKVKELDESEVISLSDYVNEALNEEVINESKTTYTLQLCSSKNDYEVIEEVDFIVNTNGDPFDYFAEFEDEDSKEYKEAMKILKDAHNRDKNIDTCSIAIDGEFIQTWFEL